MISPLRVVLSGGISGGHIFPLIAVARVLRRQLSGGVELLFIGSRGRFESDAMSAEQIPTQFVLTGKMRRYFSWQNFIDPFKVAIGFLQALWKLFLFMPDAVFSKGGSASVPVVLAAWIYRIPVLIHDSDAVAGRANHFLSWFATRIAIAYPSAHAYFPKEKTALTGNPVREELLVGSAMNGAQTLGLAQDKPTLLVLGGSQGATMLNEALLHILPQLLQAGIQVVHQTGSTNYQDILSVVKEHAIESGKGGYVAQDFFAVKELADVLALASVVLSRAGAGSIAELAATKKATILVPLQSAANDEQRMNAYDIAGIGGAVVIEEPNLGGNILLEKIIELINDPTLRTSLGEKIHAFYHPDAADAIAAGIRKIMGH
ncbi:MAG: UDP-N-acetylglucosamine--N-acetylmuramyl-(pentapeptide) pyrophosphoryl-undecaprenol N-acetylglucosamine transferase [Candidatus Moranbacteria bacterium]|nr:UDP-N-acetylglucosamine--N-acetylmuramyl-(pentapeptide) pyrophosphoryl-undecaprenol N-acetylglucosamine transferase [Candidatus Moranbacteria bacterium]